MLMPRLARRAAVTKNPGVVPSLTTGALVGTLLVTGFFAAAPAPYAATPVTITVDANAGRRAINPLIYGVAFATTVQLTDLNVPLNRQGGNTSSRYNWQQNAANHAQDWYFQSLSEGGATAGEWADNLVQQSKTAGAVPMLTVPMVGWVAKLGPNRGKLASFSIAKYGPQTGNDWEWMPDAGNGIRTSGGYVTGNDPNDANVPADVAFQQGWLNHLIGKWGTAANGGVPYYLMDNEPAIWHETHRDVHPTGVTLEGLRDKVLSYGAMVKSVDPTAQVAGPEEFGWSGFLYSGYDLQYGAAHGWSSFPDRAAHGNMDAIPWLLDQLRQRNAATGKRLLDICTIHWYPQSGEFGNNVTQAMQLLRNRSTRSLWDPNYTDESWIGEKVQMIRRLRSWVNTYYPGTKTGITEYNWGAESHMNGATAQADVLGIFGRESLDLAARWTTPAATTPTYKAIKMYRNYDGNRSTFGDTRIVANSPVPDSLSSFGALRTSDGALTLMLVNKALSGSTAFTANLANFTPSGAAQVWQLNSATGNIQRLTDLPVTNGKVTGTLPAPSITLLVIPAQVQTTFASTTTVSAPAINRGRSVIIRPKVTCATGSLADGIVDVEVYSPAGVRVAQQAWTAQSFTQGQTRNYEYIWRSPLTPGVYTVKVGVFTAGWASNPHWKDPAATVTVN
jgi:hypothetical protein